jgi:predicted nuclease of restriction endonuclease-like (RecB) superfamily
VTKRRRSNKAAKRPKRATPAGYAQFLNALRVRVRTAQVKAALAVNRNLIALYWDVGRAIALRQQEQGWGMKVVERLADGLRREFPAVGGFSRTNVYRMRTFFLAYAGGESIVPQPVGQLENAISKRASERTDAMVAQPVRQLAKPGSKRRSERSEAIVAQPVRQLREAVLPAVIADIPWGHNVILVEQVKVAAQRLWYAEQTTVQGWSRAVLSHQIGSDLYRRTGAAVTNFSVTLPAPDSELVQQLLKDPYNFDFLTLSSDALERDVQRGLVGHIKHFLLELGVGFAFVGENFNLEVGGEDFYLDLLFYHLRLRRYVVIDLKTEPFKPEFAGKMNFYLSAADDLMRHADDQASIGLILCRSHNRVIAEYAMRDTAKPMGVATYAAALPPALRDSLPSPQALARELNRAAAAENNGKYKPLKV